MVSPTRAGIANPNKIMAAPTARIVSVWPKPHKTPIHAALAMERSRLTMVETAMTWSGSVACRIPRKKPIARMANPLVITCARSGCCSAAYRRTCAGARFTGVRRRLFPVAQDAHELRGRMRQARASARDHVDVAGQTLLPHLPFFHPAAVALPLHTHPRDDGYAHAHLHKALDTLDGRHFNGHVERGAIPGEKLDDAAAEWRFDDVPDECFVTESFDVHFAAFGQRVFERDDER